MDAFQIARIGSTMPKTNGNGFHLENKVVEETINAAKIKTLSDKVERLERRINEVINQLSTSKTEQSEPSPIDIPPILPSSEPPNPKRLTGEMILKLVCQFYKITKIGILSNCRRKDLVRIRHVAMYLVRGNTLLSLPRIGELIGRRDHTTIMHGIQKITELRPTDARLDSELIHLEGQLRELTGANG